MKHVFLLIGVALSTLSVSAQSRALKKALAESPQAYALFNGEGEPVSWAEFVEDAAQADVVCFGELHDDAIMHWLQAELVRDLLAAGKTPTLGAEMLEADDQLVVNEHLEGWVNEDKLKAAANLWPNHFTDYQPLLDLAAENGLPFIATNVPRRYASYVYKNGLEALSELSDEAKAYLPPLPVPFDIHLPGYQAMMAMGGGHGGETLPMAQAIKDATMAHFILANLPKKSPFVHFNGAYHSQDHEGIVWYLHNAKPKLKVLTLHGHLQADVTAPEDEVIGRGDYLLITNERMTRTH
jgi:uncharacterized iron-regulated protein